MKSEIWTKILFFRNIRSSLDHRPICASRRILIDSKSGHDWSRNSKHWLTLYFQSNLLKIGICRVYTILHGKPVRWRTALIATKNDSEPIGAYKGGSISIIFWCYNFWPYIFLNIWAQFWSKWPNFLKYQICMYVCMYVYNDNDIL